MRIKAKRFEVARVARGGKVERERVSMVHDSTHRVGHCEAIGMRDLDATDIRNIERAVRVEVRGYVGLDAAEIVSRAVARVAVSLCRAPRFAVDGRWLGRHPKRDQVIAGRARRAGRAIARVMATGRGSMPRLDQAERVEGSPNYASWVALDAAGRVPQHMAWDAETIAMIGESSADMPRPVGGSLSPVIVPGDDSHLDTIAVRDTIRRADHRGRVVAILAMVNATQRAWTRSGRRVAGSPTVGLSEVAEQAARYGVEVSNRGVGLILRRILAAPTIEVARSPQVEVMPGAAQVVARSAAMIERAGSRSSVAPSSIEEIEQAHIEREPMTTAELWRGIESSRVEFDRRMARYESRERPLATA